MSKPKILLFYGWGWAATSPLIYTLQRNIKYAHFGYTKSFKYIPTKADGNTAMIYEKHSQGTWENYDSYKPGSHRMNLRVDLEPLDDFSLDHFTKLMEGEATVSKYIDFYHALHDHVVTKGYKSVGDVGQIKPMITSVESVCLEYTDTLKSEFDVKVLCIARDPVRRAFSNYKYQLQKKYDKWLPKSGYLPIQLKFYDYVDEINHIRKFFKDVYCIVMEELWEGDGVTGLSEFLEYPIRKSDLWKNLYAPDGGHLLEYDKDVPCQAFGQNLLELIPETYWYLRKKYDYAYQSWKQEYGSLPLYWGEPIEYNRDIL